MTITQYDSINPWTLPSDTQACAGYVGGSWPDFSELVHRFPHALHKSVAVNAGEDAEILDIENGDATPWDAPAWFRRQKERGVNPVGFYANESTMPEVIRILADAGIHEDEYVRWVAWLGGKEIPAGMHARQYTFNALGRNLDASNCLPTFWGKETIKTVNKQHYEWFPKGPFVINKVKLDERSVVQRYDKYRAQQTKDKHPHRVQLAVIRLHLRWLANRVNKVAHKERRKNGKPSWNRFRRGWRFQQLIHRANGQRFV